MVYPTPLGMVCPVRCRDLCPPPLPSWSSGPSGSVGVRRVRGAAGGARSRARGPGAAHRRPGSCGFGPRSEETTPALVEPPLPTALDVLIVQEYYPRAVAARRTCQSKAAPAAETAPPSF